MNHFFEDVLQYISTFYEEIVKLTPRMVIAAIVFSIIYLLSKYIRGFTKRRIQKRTEDLLLADFLGQTVQFVLLTPAFVMVLSILGLGQAAGSIVAGAGITAFIIGFAFKDIGENLLAGVMLAFSRPFSLGDKIKSDGHEGKVIGLTLRQTIIKTNDGYDIFLPNSSILKSPLINGTVDDLLRHEFEVVANFETDLFNKIPLIQSALKEVKGILHDPEPQVRLSQKDIGTIALKIMYWTTAHRPAESPEVETDNLALLKTLEIIHPANA